MIPQTRLKIQAWSNDSADPYFDILSDALELVVSP
jgi:hypothetical protein